MLRDYSVIVHCYLSPAELDTHDRDSAGIALGRPKEHDVSQHSAVEQTETAGGSLDSGEVAPHGAPEHTEPDIAVPQVPFDLDTTKIFIIYHLE